MNNISQKTIGMVQLALFAAIIALMAFIPFLGYIPIGPIKATTIHIPVIIGSIVLGPKRGAALGFLFGLTSFLSATFNPTIASFLFTPFYSMGDIGGSPLSLIIAFVPRILTGIVPYFVYQGLKKLWKSKRMDTLSIGIAGVAGSMTNTILVMNLIYLLFGQRYADYLNLDFNTIYNAVILYTIFTNGIVEALVAGFLVTAISKALLTVNKKLNPAPAIGQKKEGQL